MVNMPEDLSIRVLRWARTVPRTEPAARLLVVSPWLADRAFVEACIVLVDDDGGQPLAVVDWPAVTDFLATGPDGDPDARGALQAAANLASRHRDQSTS